MDFERYQQKNGQKKLLKKGQTTRIQMCIFTTIQGMTLTKISFESVWCPLSINTKILHLGHCDSFFWIRSQLFYGKELFRDESMKRKVFMWLQHFSPQFRFLLKHSADSTSPTSVATHLKVQNANCIIYPLYNTAEDC